MRRDSLEFVSHHLKRDRGFMMRACALRGDALASASPGLQDDEEVVLAAVLQHHEAISHASYRLRHGGLRGYITGKLQLHAKVTKVYVDRDCR